MGEKCSYNGGDDKCIKNFSRKTRIHETTWET